MTDNIITFPIKNEPSGLSLEIFNMAYDRNISVEEIISECLTLVNVLTIVRPELVYPVRRVACEIIGECNAK